MKMAAPVALPCDLINNKDVFYTWLGVPSGQNEDRLFLIHHINDETDILSTELELTYKM